MTRTSFGDQLQQIWRTRPVRLPRQGPIAGVAAGFGRRYNVDPVLIRVAFAVSTMFGGSGIMLYLLAWLLLPESGARLSPAESLFGRKHHHGEHGGSQTKTIVLMVALVIAVTTVGPIGVEMAGSGMISTALMLAGWWMLFMRFPEPPPGTSPYNADETPVSATGYPGAAFPTAPPRAAGGHPPFGASSPTPGPYQQTPMYTPYTKLPDSYVPESSVPGQSVPESAGPAQPVPGQAVPEQAVPEQAVPEQATAPEPGPTGTTAPGAPTGNAATIADRPPTDAGSTSTSDATPDPSAAPTTPVLREPETAAVPSAQATESTSKSETPASPTDAAPAAQPAGHDPDDPARPDRPAGPSTSAGTPRRGPDLRKPPTGPGAPTAVRDRLPTGLPGPGRQVPPAWDPLGVAPLAWDLPDPTPPRPVATVTPKRPPSRFTPVVLGLAILAAAGAGALAAAGADWMTPGRIAAVALAVIGLGLVLGAFLRRGHGLLVVTAPLAGFVLIASMLGPIEFDRASVGNREWVPASAAELDSHYELTMGDATLDLRNVRLTEDHTVDLSVRMGEVRVLVPADMTLRADCNVNLGEARCPSGLSGPGTPGAPVLDLIIDVHMGNVEVHRE
ncbi:MAG TPA: PspC domain-containing protein [Nocardia sp.]|nr:PspC domain-containing protein [Nocardia sp.]HLS78344.1 PspC domain-containing protein [Nocardia sp.]